MSQCFISPCWTLITLPGVIEDLAELLEADLRLLSPIARTVASIAIRQLFCLLLQQGSSSSSLFQAGLFRPFGPQKRWTGHQIYREQADLEVDPLCNLDPDLMGTSQVKNFKPLLCTRNPTKLRFDNILSGDNLVIYRLEININHAGPNRTLCTLCCKSIRSSAFL